MKELDRSLQAAADYARREKSRESLRLLSWAILLGIAAALVIFCVACISGWL